MGLLTDLDIVNAACAQIGEEPLETLDDESDAGQAAALLYLDVVEFNLGIYVFSFSKQIRQLSRNDGASPIAGYKYVYDLPAERIGDPLYCTDDPKDPDRRFSLYAIIGTLIHTDAEVLYAMIRFHADVSNWTPTFRGATITAIAARLALSLTHDKGLADQKTVEAYGSPSDNFRGGQFGAAIRADAFSSPPRRQDRDNNPLSAAWGS